MSDRWSDLRTIWRHTRWTLALSRETNPRLYIAFWANAVVGSLLPAGAALAVRGLVNGVTDLVSGASDDVQPVYLWLALGFVIALGVILSQALQRLIAQHFRADLGHRIQLDILNHSASLDYAYFEDPTFRDALQRANREPAEHLASLLDLTLGIVSRLLQSVSLFAILVVIEPIVLLLLLPIAAPYLWFQWRLSRRQFEEVDERTEKRRWMSYYTGLLSRESAIMEVKLLDLAPVLIERARKIMVEFRDLKKAYQSYVFLGTAVFAVISITAVYFALARATFAVIDGRLTIGDIAIFGGAATRLRGQIEGLIGQTASLRWAVLHVRHLRQFLETPPRLIRDGSGTPVPSRGAVTFRNVTFTYPHSGRPVLHDISFHIAPGETVALVGENGAGKTTIAKLLARFYDPDAGCILLDGQDLRALQMNHLRRQIAFVFQQFGRYAATARDNIAFGDWRMLLERPEQTAALARRYGVHELVSAMPNGFETMLGRQFGYHVPSGGQWQQLAIARAMVRDAGILILDEPTANLDVRSEHELFARFRELAQGRTTLLISHRFSTVQMADRILVLEGGRLIEQGTHDSLLRQGGLYAALYRLHRAQMPDSEPAADPPGEAGL